MRFRPFEFPTVIISVVADEDPPPTDFTEPRGLLELITTEGLSLLTALPMPLDAPAATLPFSRRFDDAVMPAPV